ncbi:MAG: endonuclease V [Euryarchaeota archaeon]|nr:endonuclease V [Euryarchaeota archaeon]
MGLDESTRFLAKVAERVVYEDRFPRIRRVAGFDLAFAGEQAIGACVVVDAGLLDVVDTATCVDRVAAPYIPGHLYLRELPVVKRLYRSLKRKPDLLMLDGHGVLHPARAGLASCAGVVLRRPSVGVAKSLLVGTPDKKDLEPGEWTPVRVGGETLGAAVRSMRRAKRPVYVSTGHRVSLQTAIRFVRRSSVYRVPEPTRLADMLAAEEKARLTA